MPQGTSRSCKKIRRPLPRRRGERHSGKRRKFWSQGPLFLKKEFKRNNPHFLVLNLILGMRVLFAILIFAIVATGCTSRSSARLREQNAYLAGQNAILLQHQADADAASPGVTIVGPVQHPKVPWVTGLTLAQAITTANYVGTDQPRQIIITRNGESATMDASVLLDGTDIPLQVGDVVELR